MIIYIRFLRWDIGTIKIKVFRELLDALAGLR